MGFNITDKAYLVYYYPKECELHEGMPFNCSVIEVKTNLSRVNGLIEKAYKILNGELPDPSTNCGYCNWSQEIIKL